MAAPGSHTFFHKPPVNPNLATLLHCTQISAINFPHCAVARLSAATPPLPPSAHRPPHRPSTLVALHPPSLTRLHTTLLATAAPFHLSPTHPIASSQSLPGRAVRIVIGKQISMAVLKVSALMEPTIFGPTKIPRPEERKSAFVGAPRTRASFSAYASVIERHCVESDFIYVYMCVFVCLSVCLYPSFSFSVVRPKANVKYLAIT